MPWWGWLVILVIGAPIVLVALEIFDGMFGSGRHSAASESRPADIPTTSELDEIDPIELRQQALALHKEGKNQDADRMVRKSVDIAYRKHGVNSDVYRACQRTLREITGI